MLVLCVRALPETLAGRAPPPAASARALAQLPRRAGSARPSRCSRWSRAQLLGVLPLHRRRAGVPRRPARRVDMGLRVAVRADDRRHHDRRVHLGPHRRTPVAGAHDPHSATRLLAAGVARQPRDLRTSLPPHGRVERAADLRLHDRLQPHHAERHAAASRPVPHDARHGLVAAGIRAVRVRRRRRGFDRAAALRIRCPRSHGAWRRSRPQASSCGSSTSAARAAS